MNHHNDSTANRSWTAGYNDEGQGAQYVCDRMHRPGIGLPFQGGGSPQDVMLRLDQANTNFMQLQGNVISAPFTNPEGILH